MACFSRENGTPEACVPWLLVDVVQGSQFPAGACPQETINYNFISCFVFAAHRQAIWRCGINYRFSIFKTFCGVRLNIEKVAPPARELRAGSYFRDTIRHLYRKSRQGSERGLVRFQNRCLELSPELFDGRIALLSLCR